MKVCTDACLFGAYVAARGPGASLNADPPAALHCLDIGTGTGLLSLLLAQEWTTTKIDAVEIDPAAAKQAGENFAASPWHEKLTLYQTGILDFAAPQLYDCIISNPPFFEGDLKSDDPDKNTAKHDTALTLHQLFGSITRLLCKEGSCWLLLPFHRGETAKALALDRNLLLHTEVKIRQSPRHNYFRTILGFSYTARVLQEENITIREEDGNYSERFTRLLKAYYWRL